MIRNGGIAMIWGCFMVFKMIEEANLIEKGRSTRFYWLGNKREMLFFSSCNCGIDERG